MRPAGAISRFMIGAHPSGLPIMAYPARALFSCLVPVFLGSLRRSQSVWRIHGLCNIFSGPFYRLYRYPSLLLFFEQSVNAVLSVPILPCYLYYTRRVLVLRFSENVMDQQEVR